MELPQTLLERLITGENSEFFISALIEAVQTPEEFEQVMKFCKHNPLSPYRKKSTLNTPHAIRISSPEAFFQCVDLCYKYFPATYHDFVRHFLRNKQIPLPKKIIALQNSATYADSNKLVALLQMVIADTIRSDSFPIEFFSHLLSTQNTLESNTTAQLLTILWETHHKTPKDRFKRSQTHLFSYIQLLLALLDAPDQKTKDALIKSYEFTTAHKPEPIKKLEQTARAFIEKTPISALKTLLLTNNQINPTQDYKSYPTLALIQKALAHVTIDKPLLKDLQTFLLHTVDRAYAAETRREIFLHATNGLVFQPKKHSVLMERAARHALSLKQPSITYLLFLGASGLLAGHAGLMQVYMRNLSVSSHEALHLTNPFRHQGTQGKQ